MTEGAASRRTVIADPVHGLIDFGKDSTLKAAIRAVIDNPVFQRLRHISQLGLASYVFPGATHSRFAHSLGAAHLARSVLLHLEEPILNKRDDQTLRNVTLAALLHDVGHGPFSHSFERALGADGESVPCHEQWTSYLVRTEFHEALERNGIQASEVFALLHKDGDVPRHCKQIVSSQLDVDRMDYLVRDAHHAGVSLGRIDIDYLVRSLEIIHHSNNETTLGLSPKGIRAYEAYALARHQMNQSVYFHPLVKIFEFMMEECIRCTMQSLEHDDTEIASIASPILGNMSTQRGTNATDFIERFKNDYVAITDAEIWTIIRRVAQLYDRITESPLPFERRAIDLAHRIVHRRPISYFMIKSGNKHLLENSIRRMGEEERCHVISIASTLYKDAKEPVFVNGRQPSPVTEHSFALTAFRDRPERQALVALLDDDNDLKELVRPFVRHEDKPKHSADAPKPLVKAASSVPSSDSASG